MNNPELGIEYLGHVITFNDGEWMVSAKYFDSYLDELINGIMDDYDGPHDSAAQASYLYKELYALNKEVIKNMTDGGFVYVGAASDNTGWDNT